MTIYYVDSAATGTNEGTSWTNAWTSLASAFTNVTTAGDVIYISHTHNEQLAADTTYTVGANHVLETPLKIYSVNKTNDTYAVGAFIGHGTLNRSITWTNGSDYAALMLYGITMQVAGNVIDSISFCAAGRMSMTLVDCKIYLINTATTSRIHQGYTSTGRGSSVAFYNCDFRFGNTSQRILIRSSGAATYFYGCIVSSGSTHPSTLFDLTAGCFIVFEGCDLSNIGTLTGANQTEPEQIILRQCKLKSGVVLCESAASSLDLVSVAAYDCSSGDEQGYLHYGNSYGTVQIDTGIFCNDNIADTDLSWKIVSNQYACALFPFITPWISVYHSGTTAITPYLEILRSGSATAFTDAEVWAEWLFKGTSGSTLGTFGSDQCLPLGTPANQTASSKTASDWTGEDATSWFGKIGPGSSITPAEAGDLSFRICVGAPSLTVYVDPQIRGLA